MLENATAEFARPGYVAPPRRCGPASPRRLASLTMDELLRALVELLAHHDAYCRLKTGSQPCGHPATTDIRALAVVRARAAIAAAQH